MWTKCSSSVFDELRVDQVFWNVPSVYDDHVSMQQFCPQVLQVLWCKLSAVRVGLFLQAVLQAVGALLHACHVHLVGNGLNLQPALRPLFLLLHVYLGHFQQLLRLLHLLRLPDFPHFHHLLHFLLAFSFW